MVQTLLQKSWSGARHGYELLRSLTGGVDLCCLFLSIHGPFRVGAFPVASSHRRTTTSQ